MKRGDKQSAFDQLVEVGIKHGKTEEEARKYAAKKLKINVMNDAKKLRLIRKVLDGGLSERLDRKIEKRLNRYFWSLERGEGGSRERMTPAEERAFDKIAASVGLKGDVYSPTSLRGFQRDVESDLRSGAKGAYKKELIEMRKNLEKMEKAIYRSPDFKGRYGDL